jgi:hypothetical protein
MAVDPTSESFSYTPNSLPPKNTIFFFTDRRLLKKEHGVLKKRLAAGVLR